MTGSLHLDCDAANAEGRRPAPPGAHPRWTLVACILASSLAFIDGSVVNVALPAIGRDLGAGAADLQWTVNAYMLPLSALLLLGGAAGDLFGRRRMLIGGTALFALASLGCALAPSLAMLIAARAVQGVGAAMLMPSSLATLGAAFSGAARGRAIGTWAAAGAIAGAVGPPLGGWLVETTGWRGIFLVNLPVAIAGIAVARGFVAETVERDGRALDWRGALLATIALGAMTWGLTLWSADRRAGAGVFAAIAAGLVALALFVRVQHRRGDRAMMPVALFGSRAFVGLTLLTFLLYGALGGLLVVLPFVLIGACGYAPMQAGFALLPFPLLIGLASRAMGRVAAATGSRLPLTIGPLAAGVGFALLVLVEPDRGYWTGVFPGLVVIALGMAGAVAPLTTAVLASVDARHVGTASGFNSAIARTGGMLATALSGVVIGAHGPALVAAFHGAALAGAALAVAAGIAGWTTLPGQAAGKST